MRIQIKATGFKLTPGLRSLAEEKLLFPLEKKIGNELSSDHVLNVELGKVTNHHEEGKIWKCEANLDLPKRQRTLYASTLCESLEEAIDGAKDQMERKVGDYKNKRATKFLHLARNLKNHVRITRLAQNASELYKWFRKK
ncbi:HPF/RaiA family ribosome-associated protein [Candidatus Giovannonibacteria bacterium]|nr:HPF/RaiA family ribosome-associated protein [Candidatus Giovannonibacteria bacterium]